MNVVFLYDYYCADMRCDKNMRNVNDLLKLHDLFLSGGNDEKEIEGS